MYNIVDDSLGAAQCERAARGIHFNIFYKRALNNVVKFTGLHVGLCVENPSDAGLLCTTEGSEGSSPRCDGEREAVLTLAGSWIDGSPTPGPVESLCPCLYTPLATVSRSLVR